MNLCFCYVFLFFYNKFMGVCVFFSFFFFLFHLFKNPGEPLVKTECATDKRKVQKVPLHRIETKLQQVRYEITILFACTASTGTMYDLNYFHCHYWTYRCCR